MTSSDATWERPEVLRIQARVSQAADDISRAGNRPTIESIRRQLGGGSPNAIAPALKRWKALREIRDFDRYPAAVLQAAELLYAAARVAVAPVDTKSASDVQQSAELLAALSELTLQRAQRKQQSEEYARTLDALTREQAVARHARQQADALQRDLDAAHEMIGKLHAELQTRRTRRDLSRKKSAHPSSRRAHPRLRKAPQVRHKSPKASHRGKSKRLPIPR